MDAVTHLSDIIEGAGRGVPEVRVSVGFPKSGGRGNSVIGQCWASEASADKRAQIFIHPMLEDGARVLDVLLHELVHATLGAGLGHGKEFKQLATACGLTGKMTATVASPELIEQLNAIIELIGEYPHAKLNTDNTKKQTTRLIKCECQECGYITRTSSKWLEGLGAPICPLDFEPMQVAD